MQLSRDFKIRCSAIGQIMTEPRSKSETFSKTCLTYIHEWIKEQPEFYNRRFDFKSKYTTKGNECENESIDFASKVLGWGLVSKNTEFKKNDYLTGTADIILAESVEDIKNSWSSKKFPLFANEIPVDGYGWQLQGYCELWNKPQGGLIYTLMDAPESLIEKEAYYKAKELGHDETPLELFEEMKAFMTYSNLKDDLRIKRFFVERDKDLIHGVNNKVDKIRDYIKSI